VVLSLGPHHSFPLDEVPRYVTSQGVEETLKQAILDSPMFLARWRWNLNRALLILRFRNGRKNPPPIQRMEADDMMAALFPQAAACQENVTGPIEIPDHVLVRQTIADTLHEALDVDGVRELLERMESGAVTVHCCDTTEPSVLAHEILTAAPYAFLDDEDDPQNRRTSTVQLRRGLQVDLTTIGSLDPAAVERVRDEITPTPTGADDLHDLLSALVLTRPREDWRPLWEELVARGRGREIDGPDRKMLWCTTERSDDAQLASSGDEAAVSVVLRGYLEISGVTTVDALAAATTLPATRVMAGLAVLQNEGFALQGRYTGVGETEWVARRLLARMHSYSRGARRSSTQAVSAQDFMRFLLRWQHVAPGTRLSGEAGVESVLDQLQGFEAAAVAWEPDLLAARVNGYRPELIDRLCHEGQIGWLRLTPRARDASNGSADAPVGAPSKATRIAVVFRADTHWLLDATRGSTAPAEPTVGATAEVLAVLRERGACFAAELGAATNRLPEDIERALWDGVARGLVTADGFGAVRSRVSAVRKPDIRRRSRLLRGASPRTPAAGRWSVVPATAPDVDRDELAEAVAELLLRRWGVVFRDVAVRDSIRLPWREVQWALRRLEDRGLVRGGRFVNGFSGEQYALPEVVEQLAHIRKLERTGERVTVSAVDPLNLVGVIVPGATVPAVRTNRVVYVDGLPEA